LESLHIGSGPFSKEWKNIPGMPLDTVATEVGDLIGVMTAEG